MLKEIRIDNGICFMCELTFDNSEAGKKTGMNKTMNHSIPKTLKPKLNVLIPLHGKCHKKLNALYRSTQSKSMIPSIPKLKTFLNNFEGLTEHIERYKKKSDKLKTQLIEEIARLSNTKK